MYAARGYSRSAPHSDGPDAAVYLEVLSWRLYARGTVRPISSGESFARNRLVTSRAVREQHANTVTWAAAEPPDAVFACSMLRCG